MQTHRQTPTPGMETADGSWRDAARELFFRLAASGVVPARFFGGPAPDPGSLPARTGRLSLEIVTHCWRYDHLLAYQLASLVDHPPATIAVRMTVFYALEDRPTAALLEQFGALRVAGVSWNWQPLPRTHLMRRAIGRNRAALATDADWVWFTDCDVVFHAGCLDGLAAALQGRRDVLVFPRQERVSELLDPADPMLHAARGTPRVVDIDVARFSPIERGRATGPLQVTHGDIARACGYCESLRFYQQPSRTWAKAHEDRAFRWLLRTHGEPLDVPGVYRIRHASKGRYQGNRGSNFLRTLIRRIQLRLREGRRGQREN